MKRRGFLKWGALGTAAASTGGAASAPLGERGEQTGEMVEVPNIEGRVNPTSGRIEGGRFFESGRELPVVPDTEVMVCGGGPAGIAAALASARSGARTTLLEVHGCLGGIWTAGMLGLILDSNNKGGIMKEILGKLEAKGGRETASTRLTYNPEIMKLLLEELCVEAGIRIQYFTRVVGAVRDGRRLKAVVTESKAGRQAWTAKAFIDCTGDGDLGAQAGCSFDVGRDESCTCQPMSLMTLLTGIDHKEVGEYVLGIGGKGESPKDLLIALLKKHGVHPSYAKPSLFHLNGDLFAMMANHEYGVSAFDPGAVTEATLRARAEIHAVVGALKKAGGPWGEVKVVATGSQIGIREGRRILGRYQVTAADLVAGKAQPDAVCKVTFPVDVHALTKEAGKTSGYGGHGVKAKPYDIPLGALVAKDVDGLLMAGRCISGDFIAHASYRVTGNAVAMGEAAGKAGALAATSRRMPHEVEAEELKVKSG